MIAQAVLIGSGALLLVLGLIIWTGQGDQLIPVHELAGIVLVLSLWTIAAIAVRSGASAALATLAVVWSIGAVVFGNFQTALVPGTGHWVIQVLHLLISMGVIAWGRFLVIAIRKRA